MHILIDLFIVLIIGLTAWRGWKKGVIVGLCGLLTLAVSVYGANVVATAYYTEYTQILDPFISGYVDTSTALVTKDVQEDAAQDGEEETMPYVLLSEEEKSDVYSVTYAVMRQCGVANRAAEKIAVEFSGQYTSVNSELVNAMGEYLTGRITYMVLFAAVFVLFITLFTIIENVLNLTFAMPGIEKVNRGLGAAAGAIRAIGLLLVVCCVCRYLGLFLGNDRISATWIFEKMINSNLIANMLGV